MASFFSSMTGGRLRTEAGKCELSLSPGFPSLPLSIFLCPKQSQREDHCFSSLSQISIQARSVVVMGLSETLGSDLRLLPATSKELQVNRKLLVCH